MYLSRRVFAFFIVLFTIVTPFPVAPAAAADCQFVFGFKAIKEMIPDQVGECLENEHHNPENGDALQLTTGGLLVWRKSDNWTAFTDGYRTWVNGPFGLQQRLNTERFPWENDPVQEPAPAPAPPPAADLQPNGQSWTVAFVRTESSDSRIVEDEFGNSRLVYASGVYKRVFFKVRNNQRSSDALYAFDFSLTDVQGRTYTSDVQIRQVRPDGSTVSFDGMQIAPGTTVELALTFDVAKDAAGLVLHTDGGNDVHVQ